MNRKVNRVGQNTLTVSLPSFWVKKNNVKQGDELSIEPINQELVISKREFHAKKRTAVIDIDPFNKLIINRYFHEFYRQGVEEIIVNFTKERILDPKDNSYIEVGKHIKKVVDRFIGMEIVSNTKNRIIIQALMSSEEPEKMPVIKSRIFFLIKEYLSELLDSMDNDFEQFFSKSYDYHDNISKFTYYYLRLLNFSDKSEEEKIRLSGLFIMIDLIIDKIRHTTERLSECKKKTAHLKNLLRGLFDFFLEEFDLILKNSFSAEDFEKLVEKRYSIIKRINAEKLSADEAKVIAECRIMLDTINNFSETYVSINMAKYVKET
jgi:phosphate uptake regulator